MADVTSLVRKVETRGGFIARRLNLDLNTELHRAAAPHRKTGQMDAAIKVTDQRVSPTRWRVTADVPVIQAATTDRGARPHRIYPRTKRALAFTARNGDRVVVRYVDHPGNPPYRWFSNVMTAGNVEKILRRFVGR